MSPGHRRELAVTVFSRSAPSAPSCGIAPCRTTANTKSDFALFMSYVVALLTLLERPEGTVRHQRPDPARSAAAESIFGMPTRSRRPTTARVRPSAAGRGSSSGSLRYQGKSRGAVRHHAHHRPGETVVLVEASGRRQRSLVNPCRASTSRPPAVSSSTATTSPRLAREPARADRDGVAGRCSSTTRWRPTSRTARCRTRRARRSSVLRLRRTRSTSSARCRKVSTRRSGRTACAFRRAAPAHRDRARSLKNAPPLDPRRGQRPRSGVRAPGAGRARHADARAYHHRHRHRLSTIEDADRIVVPGGRRIVEIGTARRALAQKVSRNARCIASSSARRRRRPGRPQPSPRARDCALTAPTSIASMQRARRQRPGPSP